MSTQRAVRPPATLLPHLRRARDHIDRHFAEPLDVDALARVANISPSHFVRSFSAAFGETPIRYLTRRRIERAQDLLRHANLTVTEVCTAVGFASLGSFSAQVPRAGRPDADGLPRRVGRPRRPARARLLPVHAGRAGPDRNRATWEKHRAAAGV